MSSSFILTGTFVISSSGQVILRSTVSPTDFDLIFKICNSKLTNLYIQNTYPRSGICTSKIQTDAKM